jgi:PleD family two-component response regulator
MTTTALSSMTMPANSNSGARLLIADDQRDVLEALRLLLKPEGFTIEAVTSPSGVLDALESREFDAVLIDLNYTRDNAARRTRLYPEALGECAFARGIAHAG